ncbi:hypothetical protein P691DRAFT_805272 [Macrolepiota fuliginosa MF-IS2]|uniref:F-box domain-containing protein n=1 Tax=Macrolepiota fuliginosa MF-IS2 TaxID=1400762 RepID=A0A9P5X751_9AGAR|nr:hypothetical protein P691DRAFT_805272 [Macrolepiota fuliginosa MF-IS2]
MDPTPSLQPSPVPNGHDDTVTTKETVVQLEFRLRSLDEEVKKVQSKFRTLERQKKSLKKDIDVRESLHVPINRLPPLLLRKIFCYCLPFERNSAMSNQEAPVSLGQVCSRWRQITHNTPELWAAIHIALSTFHRSGFASYANHKRGALRLHAISSWLSRSEERPLSISLTAIDTFPYTSSSLVEKLVSPYLDLLYSFRHRWRLVHLHVYGFDWIRLFFSRYNAPELPLLESLFIEGARCDTNKSTKERAMQALSREDSFLRSPNLRCVSLPLLGDLIVKVPVQWSQVTALSLSGACNCSLSQVMDTLALCLNLQSLSVCLGVSSLSADMSLEQTVTLPHLCYLRVVDYCTSFDSPRFFYHLCAPSVQSLAYERHGHVPWLSYVTTPESHSPRLFRALEAFLAKARRPVEELSLQYDWLMEGDLFEFLSLLPDLKRLSLQGSGPTRTIPSLHTDISPKMLSFDTELLGTLLTIPDKDDITVVTKDVGDHANPINGRGATAFDDTESTWSHPLGITRLFDGDGDGDGGVWQETYNFFCPKLEVFQCKGAMFSGEPLLKFLQSRASSSKRFGILRIRCVDISFALGVEQPPEALLDDIRALTEEAGISIFLHFLPRTQANTPLSFPQSPHDGLYAVGFKDAPLFNAVF